MAGFPRFAWQHARVLPFAQAGVSLADRGLVFGESLYEVLPITRGHIRWLEPHVARLRRGASVIGLASALADLDRPDTWMRELVAAEGRDEGLLYVQLTGGHAPREHGATAQPELFAYVIAHAFPTTARTDQGIRVVSQPDIRWDRCDVKTTMLLPAVLGKRFARSRGADEVVWIGDDGVVHEGGSSNVFVVERGAVVGVPPSSHVLPGVTAAIAETLATAAGIPWRHEPIDLARMRAADEVFVTATSQLAMPVLALDDRPIAEGRIGEVTRTIADLLRRDLALV